MVSRLAIQPVQLAWEVYIYTCGLSSENIVFECHSYVTHFKALHTMYCTSAMSSYSCIRFPTHRFHGFRGVYLISRTLTIVFWSWIVRGSRAPLDPGDLLTSSIRGGQNLDTTTTQPPTIVPSHTLAASACTWQFLRNQTYTSTSSILHTTCHVTLYTRARIPLFL